MDAPSGGKLYLWRLILDKALSLVQWFLTSGSCEEADVGCLQSEGGSTGKPGIPGKGTDITLLLLKKTAFNQNQTNK